MALLPPPDNRRRGRGRRTVAGSVPPVSLLSPEDIARLTGGYPEDDPDVPPMPAEAPKEPADPTRLTSVEHEEFQGVLAEILSRRSEALAIFEPMPEQERFFKSDAGERIALGGNRCLAGESVIYDPVDGCEKEIGSIDSDFHVYALEHCSGRTVVAKATKPFVKGVDDLYEITLSNGETFRSTLDHRVYTTEGYRSIRYIRSQIQGRLSECWIPTTCGRPLSSPRYEESETRTPQGFLGDCPSESRSCGGRPLPAQEGDQAFSMQLGGALGYSYSGRTPDHSARKREYTRPCRYIDLRSNLGLPGRLARHASAFLFRHSLGFSKQFGLAFQAIWRPGLRSSSPLRTASSFRRLASPDCADSCTIHPGSEGTRTRTTGLPQNGPRFPFASLVRRRTSSLLRRDRRSACTRENSLTCVVSIEFCRRDTFYDLTVPLYHNYWLASIVHHNSGKTTVACIEIARAVTSQDPHGKYPATGGKCILVGKDLTHCSKVFYQKLFKPGAFKVIKDLETGAWRTYRPNDPEDADRVREARKSPPLIPQRFYDFNKIAWEDKKNEVPKTVHLKNGWSIHFFSSLGSPPQGWNVHLVCFDEEIEHPLWHPEMSARLIDDRTVDTATGKVQGGKFIWSATPQAGTQQLYDLKVRADEYAGDDKPPIQAFLYGMLDNTWISDDAKQEFIRKFQDNQDEINVRVYGQFALLGTRVYSEFMPKGAHGTDDFPVPEDWTSYAIIDPGRQVCAILFVAVPPPGSEWAGRKIIYDELYIKRCNAQIFADCFTQRVNGRPIEYGVIDHRAGRITEIGSGKTHEQQYSDALKSKGFKFEKGGCSFMWSSDDVKAGIESVRNSMHIIDGKSELVVMRKCKWLLWELERYSYRRLPSGVVTDDAIKLNDHLADCLRYAFAAKLVYVRPRKRKARPGYTNEAIAQKKLRAKNREQKFGVGGGSFKVG